ncbi:MAG: erythromycin esterase family protein [Hamadaea sp.]|uniref:erythromycin esterase family protein n=1 Tax=Hamadaea sp. TaxID=2024425 RepID=UPI001798C92D|nr:erythromycin esterase family protein [Hamadaea sp.]NUR69683.1 erythromycin esterase family protein [Hamadaea sp.]NUT19550.1 erythromycin esterase family protein [Hamadaea sp.]
MRSLDDLGWLDDVIGSARVVAIGESAHYNAESYELRHRVLRHLVEHHGFTAYAMESGFPEGWRVDDWVRGGPGEVGEVLATGTTSLMGLWQPMRAQLEWMRAHNATAQRPVGFYGIDLGGSNASLVPGLDAVTAYLAVADPGYEVDPKLRETAAAFGAASPFSMMQAVGALLSLPQEIRDAMTANLAELTGRVVGRRLVYVERTGVEAYERVLHTLRLTAALDVAARGLARGDQQSVMYAREAAQADTVEWILRREDRVVLAAHNGHVQRASMVMPGLPPTTSLGLQLADRLGDDYRVIAMTTGVGQTLNTEPDFYAGKLFVEQGPAEPGSLDAVLDARADVAYAVDLRRMSTEEDAVLRGVTRQRFGSFYEELDPLTAYDVIVHLPKVTAAIPDADAVAASPEDVRAAYAAWARY